MNRILTTVFLMIPFFVFSQNKLEDSINSVFSQIENEEQRVEKTTELLKFLKFQDQALYKKYIDELLSDSREKGDKKREAIMLFEMAVYYNKQSRADSALAYANKGLKIGEKLQDNDVMTRAMTVIANSHELNGDYPTAIEWYNKTLTIYDTTGLAESRDKLITLYNLASLYIYTGDYDKSIIAHEELYSNSIIKNEQDFYNEVLINYGTAHYYAGNHKEAKKLLDKILITEKRLPIVAQTYTLLSAIAYENDDYIKAAEFHDNSAKLFLQAKDTLRYLAIKINEGLILKETNKLNDAEKIFVDIQEHFDKLASVPSNLRVAINEAFNELYLAKRDYKNAHAYLEKNKILQDSLLGLEKQKAISELEIKYDTEKTQREKEQAKQEALIASLENERNKSILFGTLIIAALIIASLLFYYSRIKAKKKAEIIAIELRETQKQLALQKQYRDSELKALKAQMNPHFIFNALNSIQEYIILNKKNLAGDYLGKFADLMRKYLQHSDAGYITIAEEITSLQMYLELETLRFDELLEHTINIENIMDTDLIKIPTMLVQPYVENAIKHGLLHKENDRKLSVLFTQKDTRAIQCIITDNGVGREASLKIKEQAIIEHRSFATKATESRLELLNYGKEQKIGVEIIDLINSNGDAEGTKVILEIPILKNN